MAITITTIKMGLLLARLKLGSIFTTDKTYPKDPNPDNWRTVNGAKVHLNNGKIDGGAGGKFESNAWVGKVKHGNNSFFPLNQMNYSAKAKTNAKSSQVTSQAGSAGASAAMEKAKTASQNKSASAVAEGQTSAIAAMQEYMQQKKAPHPDTTPKKTPTLQEQLKGIWKTSSKEKYEAFKNKHKLKALQIMHLSTASDHGATESQLKEMLKKFKAENKAKAEEKAAQQASMQSPEPPKSASKPYKDIIVMKHINSLKGTYKSLDADTQDEVKQIIKYAKNNGDVPEWSADAFTDADHDLAMKTVEALKNKNITPTAANNLIGALYANKKPSTTHAIAKIWLDLQPHKPPVANLSSDWPPDYKLPKGTQMLFDKSKDLNNSLFALNSATDAKGLPDNQRAAINRYTGGSSHLRDWLVYGKTDEHYKDHYYTNGMTGAAMQKCADDISAGLKFIDHPDMLVTRKCSLKDWATKENPEGISFEDLQQMEKNGTVFENQAFLSTTPIKGGTYGASNSAMRHFFVPKKAPGGYIASISEYDIEKEFLLDKKTKTRIIKVEKDQHGIIHVYEEVVL